MPTDNDFRPRWASPPGDTIVDILSERSLSPTEFAERMGQSPQETEALLNGQATITIATARRLQRVLGASVEFWMSRDFEYRQDLARVETVDQWLTQLPLKDMAKFGWVKPQQRKSDQLAACLGFFGVPSVEAWYRSYANVERLAAFRTSPSFVLRPAAVAAWLRQGEIESRTIDCSPWDPTHFEASLSGIRALTRNKNPRQFVPRLQSICAKSGVAVVIVRGPTGCPASGATRVLSPTRVLVQMSFRYLSDDQFWFTFFHEAGHVLLHERKGFFIDGIGEPATPEENEADEFAGRILIPPQFLPELLGIPPNTRRIVRFARQIGVSPGIVVGQLQHHGRLRRNYFNGLKRRFKWEH